MITVDIAGSSYEVIDEGAEQLEDIEIGIRKRAFAGNMRSSVRVVKREWRFPLLPMTNAVLAVLKTAVERGKIVSCGSVLMGVTLNCTVKVGVAPFIYKGILYERGVTVTISEA